MSAPSLFFVGLMAVGKSTIGRALAQSLGRTFFDTDQLISERAGADIAWIFDVEGEVGFRDREQQIIEEYTRRPQMVLATGGGAILRAENRRALQSRGVVIHLDSTIERLIERTSRDKKRPLLQGGDAEATLKRLHTERAALYAEIADYRFVTDRSGAKVLAQSIEAQLRKDGVL